jgi:uncharacterized protein YbjT (DUF2867 family)
MPPRHVFAAGATGYLGRAVVPLLLERGHTVRALVRPGSEKRVPPGCATVVGDPLDLASFAARVAPADTFLQMVGVPHPSPAKAPLFRSVDLASAKASARAAASANVAHFVFVSVAQPAPAMRAYWEARQEAEEFLAELRLDRTVFRPWYVLGPGHRWPYALLPFYWMAERFPPTREGARRLGLVTLAQMAAALVRAVESPVSGVHVVEVPEIRRATL